MEGEKMDPRAARTRNLIKDAFLSLVRKKDFHDVTVKDITEKAAVNRATFYAHFPDKYQLLDCTVVQTFHDNMMNRIGCSQALSEQTIRHMLVVLCECLQELYQTYRKSGDSIGPIIERLIIQQLQTSIDHQFRQSDSGTEVDEETQARRLAAANVLSWSIYGAAYTWILDGGEASPDQIADSVLPMLMHGLDSLKEKETAMAH